MANDFSGDADVVALYRFESGALTTDSQQSNDLTSVGSPSADTTDYQEGSASVAMDATNPDRMELAEADMTSDFPLKTGTTNTTFSVLFWMYYTNTGRWAPFNKYEHGTDERSLVMRVEDDSLSILMGYNSGGSRERLLSDGSAIPYGAGRWYHVKFTFDDGAWTYRLWDDTRQSIEATASGTATNTISLIDVPLVIGEYSPQSNGTQQLTGNLDEYVIFDRVVSDADQDDIIDGTYGASSSDDLTSSDLTGGTPTLDTPTIGQTHALTGSELTSAAPTLDTPTLGQTHGLTGTELTSSAPVLDTPTLAEGTDSLTSTDLTGGAPTLDTPSIGQTHALSGTELTGAAPILDTPSIGQAHALTGTELTGGTPTLDSPTLSETVNTDALTSTDLTGSAPTLDTPTIGQVHALTGVDILGGVSLDSPTLGQTHVLTGTDLTGSAPVLDTPVLIYGAAEGVATITWTAKAPGVAWSGSAPTVTFEGD